MDSKLNISKIALRNLSQRRVRSGVMMAFVFILAAALFLSSILVDSMDAGLERTVNRIGADIIVVPEAHADEMKSSLFLGESCTIYCDSGYADTIAGTEGIAQMSPQLYIATLSAACCSLPTQIIAFDPANDFVITPWLEEADNSALEEGQVIVGDAIVAQVGENLVFYEEPFFVAGRLEPTGTSYDQCVFMSFDTAQRLLATDTMQKIVGFSDPSKVISALMIRAEEGADINAMARAINYSYDGLPLKAYPANGMFTSIADHVLQLSQYSTLLIAVLFIMAGLALACIFTITIQERRREFGIFITLGALQRQLIQIVLAEALAIGIAGGAAALLITGVGTYLFRNAITAALGIPYLLLSLQEIMPLVFQCLALSLGISLLSSLYAAFRIGRVEPYALIQGDE